jgi:hypothetical protein
VEAGNIIEDLAEDPFPADALGVEDRETIIQPGSY